MNQILLTRDKIALVDDEDYNYLIKYKWFAIYDKHSKKWYAVRKLYGSNKRVYLQDDILNPVKPMIVNFKDGNSLNCTRENIRICTNAQNQHNQSIHVNRKSSIYKGVSFYKGRGLYVARIKINNKSHFIGSYINEIDAAKAYDSLARVYFGEFARTNFK